MPPAAPLTKPNAAAFHYHTYEYPGDAAAGPFQLSGGLASAGNWRFYSLVEDLNGLVAWGNHIGVPNISLTAMSSVPGGALTADVRETLVLSLGPALGVLDAPSVVITGGIHAREWIASELAYLLAEYLVLHYSTAPQNPYQQMIKRLVDHRQIFIIPMLNPDGNETTVFANRLWRKNRRWLPMTPVGWANLLTNNGARGANPPPFTNVQAPAVPPGTLAQYDVPVYNVGNGVPLGAAIRNTRQLANNQIGIDLNRNLPTLAWGYEGQRFPQGQLPVPGGAFNPAGETYFGPSGGSEQETANVQVALANADAAAPWTGITVAIDYHSRGKFILFPTEAADYGQVDRDYRLLGTTLRQLVHTQGVLDYQLGTPRQLLDTDAPGTLIDYEAQVYQTRAFVIELDPDQASQYRWMLPEGQICAVFEKNIRGALAALATAGVPTIRDSVRLYQQLTLIFNGWNVFNRGNQLPQWP
jgi:zinc carboxypeptidase